jgi:uncharacterized repeat protein (TIGR01451 family)
MRSPALVSSGVARQFLSIFAFVALIVAGGCNNATTISSTDIVGPALAITSTHTGNFSIGQQGATYTVTVTNTGTTSTDGTMVTATDALPSGMTLASMAGTGWTCTANTCTRTDVLAAGASYPAITVKVNVLPTAISPEFNQVSVSGGGSIVLIGTETDSTTINTSSLAIASAHSGSFTQGQQGVYTVTVSNASTANVVATIGTVTATETLPAGMTLVSMSGTGWTCATLPSCTRSDVLAPGASYPPITATVNVAANAATPETNNVNVSGGGSAAGTGSDPTTILALGSGGPASVQITNPQSQPIPLGTGGIVNFIAAITSGANGVGVNWTVNGIAGGNSTVGTITSSTTGATQQAMYTAPATVPGTGGTIAIAATYAGAGAAQASATVSLVANVDSNLTAGQYVFETRGFQANGLPIGMVGTFTSNGTGGLSSVLIDTTVVQSGGDSTFTSKVAWNGTYAMDTPTHGLIHLTLASNAAVQMNFGFAFSSENNSLLVELDPPFGSSTFGSFSSANASAFTVQPGGVNGAYVFELDGPNGGSGGDSNVGMIGQMTIAPVGNSTTSGTIAGSFIDNSADTGTFVSPSTVTMDNDGSGHGTIALTLSSGGGTPPTVSFYVSSSGRIYILESDSNSNVKVGTLRSQTVPSGGFTTSNALTSAMLFEAIGVNSNTGHASVILGGFSPSSTNPTTQVVGEYDANDGGTVPGGSPVQLTGTWTVVSSTSGQGTLTFTNGATTVVSFAFFLRNAGQGVLLEQPVSGITESRSGSFVPQTEPSGGFTNSTFNGISVPAGTLETVRPSSVNGVAAANFTTSGATGATDFSLLLNGYAIGGAGVFATNITDSVRGRGALSAISGTIFGATSCVFYSVDSATAILIPINSAIVEPVIVKIGN